MMGLSVVKRVSNSISDNPCGCSLGGWSFIKFTTLITRIFRSGMYWRSKSTAARVSRVGTSPAHAITTSGPTPLSLLAHSHIPMPAVQCFIAASIVRYCNSGCLPATMTLTRLRLRRQWSVTKSKLLASGGRYTRMISAFLLTT